MASRCLRSFAFVLHPTETQKHPEMGGTKNCAGPWTGGGGRGRVWEGRWGLYKGPQRPPASRISSPTAARARVQPYIGLFPLDACLRPLQRGGRGQGYRVPTARVITPRARVESQRGELRTGTGMRPRVSGLAIYLLFPPKACLCPLQRGGRGQGCCGRLTKRAPGVWLQWERSNLELNVENSQRSCARPVSRGHA